eukprot:3791699-Alexandrium_andersonii.AAC.1
MSSVVAVRLARKTKLRERASPYGERACGVRACMCASTQRAVGGGGLRATSRELEADQPA